MIESVNNSLGLPVGLDVERWSERPFPPKTAMTGRFCRLEPLDISLHTTDLFEAFILNSDGGNWTYLPYGPFDNQQQFKSWLQSADAGKDPFFHAVIDSATGKAAGLASYLRITPDVGVIEVGHIHFSPLLQRTPVSTEAMFLMMSRVFDELGYRRYEWKCDALNEPSKSAARRLGFSFEGIFRQATLYKGRNRDTAWFSILDTEWPAIKSAFEIWLSPENFDDAGRQLSKLDTPARA